MTEPEDSLLNRDYSELEIRLAAQRLLDREISRGGVRSKPKLDVARALAVLDGPTEQKQYKTPKQKSRSKTARRSKQKNRRK